MWNTNRFCLVFKVVTKTKRVNKCSLHETIQRGCTVIVWTKCMFNCTKSILLIVEEFPLPDGSLGKVKLNVIGIDCRRLKNGTWKACYWRHPLSSKGFFSISYEAFIWTCIYENIYCRSAAECEIQLRCKGWYFVQLCFLNIIHPWYWGFWMMINRLIIDIIILSRRCMALSNLYLGSISR